MHVCALDNGPYCEIWKQAEVEKSEVHDILGVGSIVTKRFCFKGVKLFD